MRFPSVGLLVVGVAGVCVTPALAIGQTATPRVLYVSHAAGHPHEARIRAGEVISALGQASGAFTVTVMPDVSQLTVATLNTYDAVVFYTSSYSPAVMPPNGSDPPIAPDVRAALLQFVSNGKGFVGLHSATDTFYTWPEYGAMIGAYFETHPWTQLATVRVEDQNHRSTKHLGASFAIDEEFYQFRNLSRQDVHVLLSLDLASVPPVVGQRSDYPLAWTRTHGAGRVFYTALGHHVATWDDPRFQEHVVQGIRWALGDADGDADHDTLPDAWELRFGLDRHSGAGANGPSGDPDADGQTNAQELAANTHPNGQHQRYLAEGATGTFFDTRIALVNPHPTATAHAQLRFMTEDGTPIATDLALPPQSRRTVSVDNVPGMASASFSTLVDADLPVVVDRTMTWAGGQAYGSHAESSVAGPSTQWYFAEGATHWRFDLFYLIQNPSPTQAAQVTASFLPAFGAPVDLPYDVPPNARLTIPVDAVPGLDAADLAAAFTSTNGVPMIVERAMYLSRPEQTWAGGHASAGAAALATRWFLAEGSSGGFFDTFVLVGNPNALDAAIRVRYLLASGAVIVREHVVPGRSRLTLNFKAEAPELADASASTIVESTNGVSVVVERAMWWPGPSGLSWYEGHSSLGTTQTGTRWALADGESAGALSSKTYVLVATTDGPPSDSLRLTVFLEDGPPLIQMYPDLLTPNRRFTFDIEAEFPQVAGKRYGVMVESLGVTIVGDVATPTATATQIVVERAMYHDVGGSFWAAGSNAVATRIQ